MTRVFRSTGKQLLYDIIEILVCKDYSPLYVTLHVLTGHTKRNFNGQS